MEKRTNPRDMVALTALALLSEQPSHPYEIQRQIRGRHKDFAAGKTRALYHAIDELVAEGLVEPMETIRDGRRPERTVFRITDDGRDELVDWLTDLLGRPVPEYSVFNIAVGFMAYLPQERANEALRNRALGLRAEIASLHAAMRVLTEEGRLPRIVLLEIEHSIAMRTAELNWVGTLMEEMRTGELGWTKEWLQEQFAEHVAQEKRVVVETPKLSIREETA
ncbi:MAG TPA: PadR family transcriptional regulator [Candidatus Dormibacteraeota bacterium]|nr:PadR family transcriptional regulator [Candidatus Dormibacteraeota bacterium]